MHEQCKEAAENPGARIGAHNAREENLRWGGMKRRCFQKSSNNQSISWKYYDSQTGIKTLQKALVDEFYKDQVYKIYLESSCGFHYLL